MELTIWPADFGLPTWEPQSLALVTYAKFTGAPVAVAHSANPTLRSIPRFKCRERNSVEIDSLRDFVAFLKEEKKFSADLALDSRRISDSAAFSRMIESDLRPLLDLLLWVDPRNRTELTRPWFAERVPFPLGGFVISALQSAAFDRVGGTVEVNPRDLDDDFEVKMAEKVIFGRAETALSSISARLGDDREFVLGTSAPCSLDALLFAHLAPLLKIPLPNSAFAEKIRANHPNLDRFVARICAKYYPGLKSAKSDQERNSASGGNNKDDAETEDKSSIYTLNTVLATGFAVFAMVGYAYTSGLVSIVRNAINKNTA